jgi:hypothetical protein
MSVEEYERFVAERDLEDVELIDGRLRPQRHPRVLGRLIRHRSPQPDAERATYGHTATIPLPDDRHSLAQIWDAFEDPDEAS